MKTRWHMLGSSALTCCLSFACQSNDPNQPVEDNGVGGNPAVASGVGGNGAQGTGRSSAVAGNSSTIAGGSSALGASSAAGGVGATTRSDTSIGGSSTTSASTATAGAASAVAYDTAWFKENTIANRNAISVPAASAILASDRIATQLTTYDPGSMIRCSVHDDPAYRTVIDALGGVTWGYPVSVLEDESKPRFMAGFPYLYTNWAPTAGDASGASAVEIEEADIIGISESSALFYSPDHGLLLVDLSAATPAFTCATKLPGRVSKFFFYKGHLVVMTESLKGGTDQRSSLLHFTLSGGVLSFVESVDLGRGSILDTRRFNDKLVVYTSLALEDASASSNSGTRVPSNSANTHRMLRVFKFGNQLAQEMTQTLLDTTPNQAYWTSGALPSDTAPGALVYESSNFGHAIWASDHYFVVTEALTKTYLSNWVTQTYTYCSKGHSVPFTYRHCDTVYETRPNPNYTPPDNSGGDRECQGTTLADCLRAVSRASNPTIQVPVGTKCEDRTSSSWTCDEYKSGSYTYPQFNSKNSTRLYIYEYTDQGFVKLDSKVREISTTGLDGKLLSDKVPALTTSSEAFDLSVPGSLQTLYFQNGFLYAIADGILQVYSMGDSSMVRTSSLQVVNSGLQTSLFSNDKIYLSDFGYSGSRDQSVLRVVDLTNPAFPRKVSDDRTLPGGHSSILPTSRGILTIGSVSNFEPGISAVLKLGLFTDPFATELAYLILGTDLNRNYLGDLKSPYFDNGAERLFLPYYGYARDSYRQVSRVGISHLETNRVVSEGAVELPELPLRVRPKPGATGEVLSFSSGAVEWLRQAGSSWSATPLLEYYKPVALYRTSDKEDYVQVLRLGNRCQLHFAIPNTINTRVGSSLSQVFECGPNMPWAYEQNLIFDTTLGVHFSSSGEVTSLSSAEIANLSQLRPMRPTCVFSQQRVSNTEVDFKNPPDLKGLVCYSPDAYASAERALPRQ